MTLIRPVAAGILLALLSCAGDTVDLGLGPGRDVARILRAVTSSGLLWGLGALLLAVTAGTRRRAVTQAVMLPVTATVTYFLMIVLVTGRWSGDVAGTAAVWLAVSVAAGFALGILGNTVRHDTGRRAAVAAGIACGLLACPAVHALLIEPPAELMGLVVRGADEFYRSFHPAAAIGLVVPVLVLVWLATRYHLGSHRRELLLSAGLTAVGGAVLWLLADVVRWIA
ncbi:hypothetical protein [Actinoplanes derwentensis]|uniref:hypothetical protein n=1 Tax=Actinoplanes derwentensis TaxID=113562 RepID=UPI000B82BE91|nr:hypothetical protein [Actinoplanes derwentensis]GID87401.1 hypothetical protein Ade03nite_63250 [Actinoplanes derwentensis]